MFYMFEIKIGIRLSPTTVLFSPSKSIDEYIDVFILQTSGFI